MLEVICIIEAGLQIDSRAAHGLSPVTLWTELIRGCFIKFFLHVKCDRTVWNESYGRPFGWTSSHPKVHSASGRGFSPRRGLHQVIPIRQHPFDSLFIRVVTQRISWPSLSFDGHVHPAIGVSIGDWNFHVIVRLQDQRDGCLEGLTCREVYSLCCCKVGRAGIIHRRKPIEGSARRSEEHTSELQSRF